MSKEELLKEVWKQCTLQEILNAGYDCEAIQAIDVVKEVEQIDKDSFKVSLKSDFIENLRDLFNNTPSRNFPEAWEVMEEIKIHYDNESLMCYFDRDEMLKYCDDTPEMDEYLKDKIPDIIEEYIEQVPSMIWKIIIDNLQNALKMDFKRFLCDLVNVGYFASNEEIFERLKERM